MSEALDPTLLSESNGPDGPGSCEEWKSSGGVYAAPEPRRFAEFARNVPLGDSTQMAKVAVRYALERAGLLMTPEQLNEPFSEIDPANELERARVVDSFLEYCDFADMVWRKIEEASELSSQYSFDQIRSALPDVTKGADATAAMNIVKAMNKSKDETFARIGNITKSHGSAILRIMYAWEQGIELPKPGEHLSPAPDAVS